MKTLHIVSFAALVAVGCSKDEAASSFANEYKAIDKMLASAKSDEDFLNAGMECLALVDKAAPKGIKNLAENPEYLKHCRIGLENAMAKQAIAKSKPDDASNLCMASSSGLKKLVKENINVAESKRLLARVNAACGL